MKHKIFLFGIITFLAFTTYSQSEKNNGFEIKIGTTKLDIVVENLDELENFDWNGIKEVFKSNDGEEIITLSFAYIPKISSKLPSSEIRIDNFKINISGKSSDIDNLIDQSKKTMEKLIKVNESYSKMDNKN